MGNLVFRTDRSGDWLHQCGVKQSICSVATAQVQRVNCYKGFARKSGPHIGEPIAMERMVDGYENFFGGDATFQVGTAVPSGRQVMLCKDPAGTSADFDESGCMDPNHVYRSAHFSEGI